MKEEDYAESCYHSFVKDLLYWNDRIEAIYFEAGEWMVVVRSTSKYLTFTRHYYQF